jgi:hypothetical protein
MRGDDRTKAVHAELFWQKNETIVVAKFSFSLDTSPSVIMNHKKIREEEEASVSCIEKWGVSFFSSRYMGRWLLFGIDLNRIVLGL